MISDARDGRGELPDDWRRLRAELDAGFARWTEAFFGDLSLSEFEAIRQALIAGKRVRGGLVCLVCEALGGDVEAALPRAVAIECIQAASLIHDDYVDADRIRRGRPALWTVTGPRKAVLLGDVMFATVIRKMVALSARDGAVVAGAIATMASGAYREFTEPNALAYAIAKGEYRRKCYEEIIQLKTGALFSAAAELGAVAADAPGDRVTRASAFGARLGQAYQIADDLAEIGRLDDPSNDLGDRLPALIPVLLYFCPEAGRSIMGLLAREQSAAWPDGILDTLKRRMREAIVSRLHLAARELKGFPAGASARMEAMAGAIVQVMAQEAERNPAELVL
jgi:hypothetical protein